MQDLGQLISSSGRVTVVLLALAATGCGPIAVGVIAAMGSGSSSGGAPTPTVAPGAVALATTNGSSRSKDPNLSFAVSTGSEVEELTVEYSQAGGPFQPATLASVSAGAISGGNQVIFSGGGAASVTIVWDSAASLGPDGHVDVTLRVTPRSPGGQGTPSDLGPLVVGNTAPTVEILVPSAGDSLAGNAVVQVRLVDNESDPLDLDLRYVLADSSAGALTLAVATPLTGLATLPGPAGNVATFVWDSAADLAGQTLSGAKLVVTPDDSDPATAEVAAVVTGLALDNNQAPSVLPQTPLGPVNSNVQLFYRLVDADSDTCTLTVEYSVAGGVWKTATEADTGWIIGQAESGSTTTFVSSDLFGREPGFYRDRRVEFTGGANAGAVRIASDYDVLTHTLTLDSPLPVPLDATTTWRIPRRSEGLASLRSSPAGVWHVFCWDSLRDLGTGEWVDVTLRLRATDSKTGLAGEVQNLTVTNSNTLLRAMVEYPCGPVPYRVVTGDFDGDTLTDVAILHGTDDARGIGVYYQDAQGGLGRYTSYSIQHQASPQYPRGLFAGDLDRNGSCDLVCTGLEGRGWWLEFRQAGGLLQEHFWSPSWFYPVKHKPEQVVLGEVHGANTNRELLWVSSYPDNSGSYANALVICPLDNAGIPQSIYTRSIRSGTVANQPASLVTADVDGDGDDDVVTANRGANEIGLFTQVAGLLGNMTPSAVGSDPTDVAVGRFDMDSTLDVAVANAGEDTVGILRNPAGNGAFLAMERHTAGALPRALDVSDFDGDGRDDIVVANGGDDTLGIFLQDSVGNFCSMVPFLVGREPADIAVADISGDGLADIVVAHGAGSSIGVLLGGGTRVLNGMLSLAAPAWPIHASVGDFNADGLDDVVVLGNLNGDITVYLQQPGGALSRFQSFSGLPYAYTCAVGDVTGDGKADVVLGLARQASGLLATLKGNGDGTFGPPVSYSSGRIMVTTIDIGDLDADGRADLACGGQDNGISVLYQQVDGTLGSPTLLSTPRGIGNGECHGVAILDMDLDGRNDIAASGYGSGSVHVWYRDASGFAPRVDGAAEGYLSRLAVSDLNQDGLPDLVTTRPAPAGQDGRIHVFFQRPGRTLAPVATYFTGSIKNPRVTAPAILDLNHDGLSDVVVSDRSQSTTYVFFQRADHTFVTPALTVTGGNGSGSPVVGDFNSDGLSDFACPNAYSDTLGVFLSR